MNPNIELGAVGGSELELLQAFAQCIGRDHFVKQRGLGRTEVCDDFGDDFGDDDNYRVTAFRVDPVKATLQTLCDTDKIPTPKMQILCTEKTPKVSPGLSLIDVTERRQVLQLMADIRSFIVRKK